MRKIYTPALLGSSVVRVLVVSAPSGQGGLEGDLEVWAEQGGVGAVSQLSTWNFLPSLGAALHPAFLCWHLPDIPRRCGAGARTGGTQGEQRTVAVADPEAGEPHFIPALVGSQSWENRLSFRATLSNDTWRWFYG